MKIYLLLPLILSLGCNAVKNSNLPIHADQLLKDTKTLSSDSFEGRKTGTKGAELARNYISKRFREIGLKSFPLLNSYQQAFSFSGIDDPKIGGKNLIGYIAGRSDKVIVISAHYDHLGVPILLKPGRTIPLYLLPLMQKNLAEKVLHIL
jgi:hypothetical protein